MQATLVFGTWRQILRNSTLQRRLFEANDDELAREFGFTPEEVVIARAYAADEKAVRMSVTNYRFRLISAFGNALETSAPLTFRALQGAGFNLRTLAVPFLDAIGWRDYGPYVYTHCAQILDYLAERDETEQPAGLRDLIELERVAGGLVRRHASLPVPSPAPSMGHWALTGRAQVVYTHHDLAPWLREASLLGKTDLPPRPAIYLVALPDLTRGPKFSALSPQTAAALEALHDGSRDIEAIRRRVAARVQGGEDVATLLAGLEARGAVCRNQR